MTNQRPGITYIIRRLDVHQEAKEGRDVHLGLQVGQGPAAPVLEVVLGLLLPVVVAARVLVPPLLVLVVVIVHVVTPLLLNLNTNRFCNCTLVHYISWVNILPKNPYIIPKISYFRLILLEKSIV